MTWEIMCTGVPAYPTAVCPHVDGSFTWIVCLICVLQFELLFKWEMEFVAQT